MLPAVEQLSLWATTTEARVPRAAAPQHETPRQREAQAPQLKCSRHSARLQKAREQQQKPSADKN